METFKKYTPMEFQKEFNLFKIHISPYSQLLQKNTSYYFHYTSFHLPNNELYFFATLMDNNETEDANKYLLRDIQLLGVGNLTEKICFEFLDDGTSGKELKYLGKKWLLFGEGENGKKKQSFLFNKINSNLKIYLQQKEGNKGAIEQLERIQKTLDLQEAKSAGAGGGLVVNCQDETDDEGEGEFV
jgi:hypothetical protein